jgi:quinol monooxygenase YgiN
MIIVAGTVRFPEDRFDTILAAAETIIGETRKEAGCIVYSFSRDLVDRGLLRIYEEWESRAHLDAHVKQPHMGPWRAAVAAAGATERNVKTYEASPGAPL